MGNTVEDGTQEKICLKLVHSSTSANRATYDSKINHAYNSSHNMQCINVPFTGQISPSTLCGSSTQYPTNEIMGPASADSLLKYVKFDIMESILSFRHFFALIGGNSHNQKYHLFNIPTTTSTSTTTTAT